LYRTIHSSRVQAGTGVAFDHALAIVIGMMAQRFEWDVDAGSNLDQRFQRFAEITSVRGLVGRLVEVMVLARLDRRPGDQRHFSESVGGCYRFAALGRARSDLGYRT
jgi:hypothetical protein